MAPSGRLHLRSTLATPDLPASLATFWLLFYDFSENVLPVRMACTIPVVGTKHVR